MGSLRKHLLHRYVNVVGFLLLISPHLFNTYLFILANCLKTIMEHEDHKKESDQKTSNEVGKFGVFAATTAVNSASSMVKDKFYARHFGSSTAASIVPKATYCLWGLRDCMVIGSSFILPDIFSSILAENTDMDRAAALKVSQLACPVAAQFVSTL